MLLSKSVVMTLQVTKKKRAQLQLFFTIEKANSNQVEAFLSSGAPVFA